MSRSYRCDQCGEPVAQPIACQYPVFGDDEDADGDDTGWPTDEIHLCSYTCLAAWAMDAALDT